MDIDIAPPIEDEYVPPALSDLGPATEVTLGKDFNDTPDDTQYFS